MSIDYSNPQHVSALQKAFLDEGYLMEEFNKALGPKIKAAQAASGAQAGYLTPSQAITQGGLPTISLLQQMGVPAQSDLTTATKTIEQGRKDLLDSVTQAQAIMKKHKGKNLTGVETAFLRQLREQVGLVNPESIDAWQALSNVQASYAFSVGGKQFTETEMALIEPNLPSGEEAENVVNKKLANLKKFLEGKLQTDKSLEQFIK